MAITTLLSSSLTPLFPSTHHSPTFLRHHSLLLPPLTKPTKRFRISSQSKDNNNNSIDPPDRIIAAVCYFYPFFDGVQYGKYVITQFAPLQVLLQPLVPAIRVFKSFPFNGFLVFLALYFAVVRNPNFSRYVRFNTMQAIVLDVLLIFPDLLERSFNPREGVGLDLLMSLDSTVFLFLLVSLVYGSSSCLLGQLPRLPIVAEAAERTRLLLSTKVIRRTDNVSDLVTKSQEAERAARKQVAAGKTNRWQVVRATREQVKQQSSWSSIMKQRTELVAIQ